MLWMFLNIVARVISRPRPFPTTNSVGSRVGGHSLTSTRDYRSSRSIARAIAQLASGRKLGIIIPKLAFETHIGHIGTSSQSVHTAKATSAVHPANEGVVFFVRCFACEQENGYNLNRVEPMHHVLASQGVPCTDFALSDLAPGTYHKVPVHLPLPREK